MQTAVLEPGKVREADQQKRGGGRKPAANSACGLQNERAFCTASASAVFKASAGSFWTHFGLYLTLLASIVTS